MLTFRPEFQTPWPAVAHQTSLTLNRLTRRQIGELMRKKLGTATPEAVVEQIYERTAGVPLFVEEFTKLAQESGVLDEPCPALAAARRSRRGPCRGDGRLRYVYGRFHDTGPRGGRVASGSAGLRSIAAQAAHSLPLS